MKLFVGTWIMHPVKSGAFAGVFDNGEFKNEPILGFVGDVTVAKLKLVGIISCLERLRQPSQLTLVTDASDEYVYYCVNEWISCWSQNGWKAKSGHVVANQAEVERLSQLLKTHSVTAAQPESQQDQTFHDSLVATARDQAFQCGEKSRAACCPPASR